VTTTMRPHLHAFTVTFDLAAGQTSSTFANVILAPNEDTARLLGEKLGQAAADSSSGVRRGWTFDPSSIRIARLDASDLAGIAPLLTQVEEEIAHSNHVQRILAAMVARYGPLALTAAEVDAVIPADLTQVNVASRPDTTWWVLPHQFHVPGAVAKLPDLPDTGLVAGPDLHQHPGREVLVSTDSENPSTLVPASRWQWRTILDVRPHPAGTAWLMLHTEHGAQPITTAGLYSVRDPRPAPYPPTQVAR
jgi:hypothetical protein